MILIKTRKFLLFCLISAICFSVGDNVYGQADSSDSLTDPSGFCSIEGKNTKQIVYTLRNECTPAQTFSLYRNAKLGILPNGYTTITLLPASYSSTEKAYSPRFISNFGISLQQNLGDGVTFTKKTDGSYKVFKNYFWGHSSTVDITKQLKGTYDGKPVYMAKFVEDFAGLIPSYHEYRQLTPTVWIVASGMLDKNTHNPSGKGSNIFILSQ